MPDYELKHISEIISALGVIKEECKKYAECSDCPFYIAAADSCGITRDDPHKWNIVSNYIWRTFR